MVMNKILVGWFPPAWDGSGPGSLLSRQTESQNICSKKTQKSSYRLLEHEFLSLGVFLCMDTNSQIFRHAECGFSNRFYLLTQAHEKEEKLTNKLVPLSEIQLPPPLIVGTNRKEKGTNSKQNPNEKVS